ncbi:MAG: YceI family protein, partial [Pseudobdellovibrionaceae bacterium]
MKAIALVAFALGVNAYAQDVYTIDPSHTSIVFKVSHMGFSNVQGMFAGAAGKITVDEKAPEKSSFEVSVKADTVNTNDKKRDDHLKGPDFFNVKQ